MSSPAYCSLITTPGEEHKRGLVASPGAGIGGEGELAGHRQAALSPSSSSSMATSSSSASNSSLSLYQLGGGPYAPPSSSSLSSSASSTTSTSSSSRTSSSHHKQRNQWAHPNQHQHPHHHLLRRSSITPTQEAPTERRSQLFHSYTLHSLEPKPLKPYKSNSEYLEAMREDLAEWFNRLYPELDLTPENFFARLETGSIICRHANQVTRMGRQHMEQENLANSINSGDESFSSNEPNNNNNSGKVSKQPRSLQSGQRSLSVDARSQPINWFQVKVIPFRQDAQPGTFMARDNICQFILWCRSLNILECLLFETDDLVARKNEKSFILCLLEVARIGFKVGMPTPLIIQLEQEIDREIENDAKLQQQLLLEEEKKQLGRIGVVNEDDDTIDSFGGDTSDDCYSSSLVGEVNLGGDNQVDLETAAKEGEEEKKEAEEEAEEEEEEEDSGPKPQVITNDLLSLHEKVVQLLCQCTCPTQFPMVRVGDNGKYKVGDKLIIFVRILRRHIMVRVGGGWQELSEFLRVKDPCRSKSPSSSFSSNSQLHLHQHQQLVAKLAPNSRSRFGESSHHLNNRNFRNASSDGHRLISGSASMGWLSHNS